MASANDSEEGMGTVGDPVMDALETLGRKQAATTRLTDLQDLLRRLVHERSLAEGLEPAELAAKVGTKSQRIKLFLQRAKPLAAHSKSLAGILAYARGWTAVNRLSAIETGLLENAEALFQDSDLNDRELGRLSTPRAAVALLFDVLTQKISVTNAQEAVTDLFCASFGERSALIEKLLNSDKAALFELCEPVVQGDGADAPLSALGKAVMAANREQAALQARFDALLDERKRTFSALAARAQAAYKALGGTPTALEKTGIVVSSSFRATLHGQLAKVSLKNAESITEKLERAVQDAATAASRDPAPGRNEPEAMEPADGQRTEAPTEAHRRAAGTANAQDSPQTTTNRQGRGEPARAHRLALFKRLQAAWIDVRDRLGLTVPAFASQLGMEQTLFRDALQNRGSVEIATFETIAQRLDAWQARIPDGRPAGPPSPPAKAKDRPSLPAFKAGHDIGAAAAEHAEPVKQDPPSVPFLPATLLETGEAFVDRSLDIIEAGDQQVRSLVKQGLALNADQKRRLRENAFRQAKLGGMDPEALETIRKTIHGSEPMTISEAVNGAAKRKAIS